MPWEPPDLSDQPISGLDADQQAVFDRGDELFDLSLRDADGLGPLYARASCGQCHDAAARGPGVVQKFGVMQADGITPHPDQSKLTYGHTERPLVTAGATTPLIAPKDPDVRISRRSGPPVMGLGYLEAVADETLAELERAQASRDDGVSGRRNRGRFGLKARLSTLDEFTADALLSDMGITSPLRPNELPNPDGLTDDMKPGVDLTMESLKARADYLRLLAIPRRKVTAQGRAAFEAARCDACHVQKLRARADYPVRQIAGVEAEVFTDLLLHDMGAGLADGLAVDDGDAGPREWRTAPLIGLRFSRRYLHDSRAGTVAEAIELHFSDGSEANDSVSRFRALPEADRAALIAFVEAL